MPRSAKLTNDKREQIRADYAAGGVTMAKLAERFDVSPPMIHAVVHGHRSCNRPKKGAP